MHSRQAKRLLDSLLKRANPRKGSKATIYNGIKDIKYPDHVRVIDYRSDTFSKPSQQMRQVMFEAKVGDDVYGEDPTVNELERKAATLFGKESAMFCASGTMSNLLAVMTHSDQRGCEVIVGDESHILMWEQAGAAQIAGAQLRTVVNKPSGTFDVNEMISKIRSNNVKFLPRTSLVCVENTHNSCGGRVLPISWIDQLGEVLKDFNVPLHMDGARFFNSVVFYGAPAADAVKGVDSISLCLSKGLGAPLGSLLIGSSNFIEKARYLRKVIGGGMRQVGLMAAAGIYALDHMVDRLQEDHDHAYAIGKAVSECGSSVVSVDLESVETNILLINLDTTYVKSDEFCRRLSEEHRISLHTKRSLKPSEEKASKLRMVVGFFRTGILLPNVSDEEMKSPNPTAVKMLPWSPSIARLVVCCNNTTDEQAATIEKMRKIVWEFDKRAEGKKQSSIRT